MKYPSSGLGPRHDSELAVTVADQQLARAAGRLLAHERCKADRTRV